MEPSTAIALSITNILVFKSESKRIMFPPESALS